MIQRQYTLIEYVIVIAVIGLIAAVSAVVLSAGINAFHSHATRNKVMARAETAIEMMKRDIRNATEITVADPDKIEFAIVYEDAEGEEKVEEITYSSGGGALLRNEKVLAEDLESLNLEYIGAFFRWIEGYTDGTGERYKSDDHMYLLTGADSVRTYVTDIPVSLAGIDEIAVEWEQTGSAPGGHIGSYLVVSNNAAGTPSDYFTRIANSGTFSARTDLLDVSGVGGEYYVRVHAENTHHFGSSELKVHDIVIGEEEGAFSVLIKLVFSAGDAQIAVDSRVRPRNF